MSANLLSGTASERVWGMIYAGVVSGQARRTRTVEFILLAVAALSDAHAGASPTAAAVAELTRGTKQDVRKLLAAAAGRGLLVRTRVSGREYAYRVADKIPRAGVPS